MKILIFTLLFSSLTFAQAPDCDENGNPLNAMTELATPNCLNSDYLDPAKTGDIQKLCNECRPKFQKFFDKPIGELKKDERKTQFIDAALKEYQKNITENLLESMKLRAMRPTGSSFDKSIEACKMKNLSSFSSQCNSQFAVDYLSKSKVFNDFNKSISVELGKILSNEKDYSPENALLKRNAPACFIPEKDVLYITISALEEVLTPQMINALASLDPKQYSSIEEMFMDEKVMSLYAGEDIFEIASSFKTHPLVADKFNTPTSMSSFFKSIRDPKNVENLRSNIYDKANGDNFDARLASKCDESFKTLKAAICSKEFEDGKFDLNPFQNYRKIHSNSLKSSDDKFTTTEELEKKNFEILKLCEPHKSNPLTLTSLNSKINKALNPNYTEHSLDQYKLDKHDKDIGKINENLCQRKTETCSDNSLSCKMLLKYKELLNPASLDYRLANSSNKEVNTLLRSMIGDTSQVDAKTRAILVAQGIIPQDNGELIAQPDIPERKPEFFAENKQGQNPGLGTSSSTRVAATGRNGRNPASDREDSSSNTNPNSNNYNNLAQNSLPDISDMIRDQEEEFRGFQDELRRRLSDQPRPATLADATKVVQQSAKKSGRRLTPIQERAFAERIMQPAPAPQSQGASVAAQTPVTENRAAVSNTESQLDKWKKGQKDAALMGMAGAQAVSAKDIINSANDAKPKELTKVALNINEDPRVTLSDIFNNKIDQNDSETQLLKVLLRNKNNFLLQVKSLNFKIVFDEKKNFNVLLDSGDKAEAERIRPQLEMFLKKLKV